MTSKKLKTKRKYDKKYFLKKIVFISVHSHIILKTSFKTLIFRCQTRWNPKIFFRTNFMTSYERYIELIIKMSSLWHPHNCYKSNDTPYFDIGLVVSPLKPGDEKLYFNQWYFVIFIKRFSLVVAVCLYHNIVLFVFRLKPMSTPTVAVWRRPKASLHMASRQQIRLRCCRTPEGRNIISET